MRTHSRLLSLFALLLALASGSAHAIKLTITGGEEAAIPIAIVPFALESGSRPNQDIAGIVINDLRRSGMFDVLAPDSYLAKPSQIGEVSFQNWRATGADYLVIGGVRETSPGRYQIRFDVLDVYKGTKVIEPDLVISGADNLRSAAHIISDEIYKALTGRDGGFGARMAYVAVRERDGKPLYQLSVADSDGELSEVILTSTQPLMSPSWSPDGQQVAYVSFENRRSEIWIQTVKTGQRQKVASFAGINGAPAWSPDGSKLALTLSKDGNPDIYVLELRGGALRQLTQHWAIDTEPTWSPDGRRIAFTSDRGGKPQIYWVSAGGGEPERVTYDGSYNARPEFSPDGKRLAMVHRDDYGYRIAVLDLASKQLRVLTEGPLDEAPSFSPNGTMLMYSGTRGGRTGLSTVSVFGRADYPVKVYPFDVREPAWSLR